MSTGLLALYGAVTAVAETGAPAFLHWRMRRGKEDPLRLSERMGHPGQPRPAGPLAWVHGASVGEGLALLPFIEGLRARGFSVLLTTGTVTSSRVLAARLPPGVIHQFAPLDGPRTARRFLDHWRPDLVCFAESELWPNLLRAAHQRAIPLVLVNARMSERSFARWGKAPGMIAPLLGLFDCVLAQTDADAARLQRLGAQQVVRTGNLKFDVPPPPADPTRLAAIRAAVGDRPVWVAASTHAGEDLVCCVVHVRLKNRIPGLLTVIVPRKVDRGPVIAAHAAALGLSAILRSGAEPLAPATDLYIADTMGEVGLLYRLSRVAFVGKSLGEGRGGQNPIEPAKLGAAVLHGPNVANFAEVYDTFDRCGGGLKVTSESELAETLQALLTDPVRLAAAAARASDAVTACAGATAQTMQAIEPLCAAILDSATP